MILFTFKKARKYATECCYYNEFIITVKKRGFVVYEVLYRNSVNHIGKYKYVSNNDDICKSVMGLNRSYELK